MVFSFPHTRLNDEGTRVLISTYSIIPMRVLTASSLLASPMLCANIIASTIANTRLIDEGILSSTGVYPISSPISSTGISFLSPTIIKMLPFLHILAHMRTCMPPISAPYSLPLAIPSARLIDEGTWLYLLIPATVHTICPTINLNTFLFPYLFFNTFSPKNLKLGGDEE